MSLMYETTPELFTAVTRAAEDTGWTWAEVKDRGGPSSTTMTKLRQGTLDKVNPSTLRKLDAAFGWDKGTGRGLVSDDRNTRMAAQTAAVVRPEWHSEPHHRNVTGGVLTVTERAEVSEALMRIGAELVNLGKRIAEAPDDRA